MMTSTRFAIEKAGGSRVVARALGITRQAVEQWDDTPPKHVLALERMSGVTRYELRPDIYGTPPKSKAMPRHVA